MNNILDEINKLSEMLINKTPTVKLMSSVVVVDKTQRRKNRKKRINKKWLKKYGYKDIPSNKVYVVEPSEYCRERIMIVHPKYYEKIKNKMDKCGMVR